jgi:hypothetical protein
MGRVVAASRVARPRVASRVARDAPRGDVALELRRRVRANGRGGGDEGKHRVGARVRVCRAGSTRARWIRINPCIFSRKSGMFVARAGDGRRLRVITRFGARMRVVSM